MIELHRPDQHDELSDKLEQRLLDMVAAHKVKRHPSGSGRDLPYLKENDRVITGEEDMNALLRDVEQELREQRMVSGDACYIDPQTGEMC